AATILRFPPGQVVQQRPAHAADASGRRTTLPCPRNWESEGHSLPAERRYFVHSCGAPPFSVPSLGVCILLHPEIETSEESGRCRIRRPQGSSWRTSGD